MLLLILLLWLFFVVPNCIVGAIVVISVDFDDSVVESAVVVVDLVLVTSVVLKN